MKTRITITCIVALSLAVFIPQASACSCAEPNIEDAFSEADNVIFSGKVTEIKEQQRTYLVSFELYQSWKGIPNDLTEINIMTFQSSSTCGYDFSENQSYLVEAYGKWDQTPEAGICGVTAPLESAGEQISFLNKQIVNAENIDEILEKTKKFLEDNEFDKAIILHTDIDYSSKHVVVTIAPEEFTEEHTAEYYEENLEDWIPFDTRILIAKAVDVADILSPLKQQQNGVAPNKVECKDGLYRAFSESNGKAICATGYTISELIHRGWAESHNATSSATISHAGDAIRNYCPEGTKLVQGGWYVPFTKYPNVEQISVQELYDAEYDSQGIEFTLNPLNNPETFGKTMVFVFVDCDLSFDYFEVLILPNTIENRKNFVVHYPTVRTNTIHFDNQDDISYKIDGIADREDESGGFTVWLDPQDDWFIDEIADGYEGVSKISLSASNPETGELYDWMNYNLYLTQQIAD